MDGHGVGTRYEEGRKEKLKTGAMSLLALDMSQMERNEIVVGARGAGNEVMLSSRSLIDPAIGHLLVSKFRPRMTQYISYGSLDGKQSLG